MDKVTYWTALALYKGNINRVHVAAFMPWNSRALNLEE